MRNIGFKNEAFEIISIHSEKNGKTIYNVKCNKCGNIYQRTVQSVKKYQGKGCLDCTPRFSKTTVPYHSPMYHHYKKHAEDKNRNFDLTLDQFYEIIKKDCHYCGSKPKINSIYSEKYGKNKIPEPFNGVDRIDSSLGYSVNNCLPCCEKCNKMKLVYETNDFLNHIKQIYEFNNLNLRFND